AGLPRRVVGQGRRGRAVRGVPEVRAHRAGLQAALHPTGPAVRPDRPGQPRRRHAAGAMKELVERLYPVCRSITGNGLRRTLEIIGEQIPLAVSEVPTGTQVLDWTVPREWNIRDAWVKDAS